MNKLESPKSWAEIAGKHVDAKLDSVALNVENVNKALYLQKAREAALEEQDKECRRNNIIIYRVQESTATSAEDRLREDVRFCQNLLIGLNAGVIDEDLKKVQRLGRRVDAQTAPRPILLQFASTHWQKKWPGDATVRVVSISPLDRALGSHCEMARKIFFPVWLHIL